MTKRRQPTARPWPQPHESGAILAISPLPFAVLGWVHDPYVADIASWPLVVACLSSATLLLAGFLIPRAPRTGRVLATAAAMGLLALATKSLLRSPFLALTVLLVLTGALGTLWNADGRSANRSSASLALAYRLRGASVAALVLWMMAAFGDHSPIELLAIACSFLIAGALAVQWSLRERFRHPVRASLLGIVLAASAIALVPLWGAWWPCVSTGVVVAVTAAIAAPAAKRVEMERTSWWEPLLGHPERLLVGAFATLSAAGTLLLALPQSSATAEGIGFLDSSFTAVSAVCVTGLIVLDTPVDFSPLGQVIILVLIQLGGLGIMTFSTAALRLLGRRVSLRHERAVASLISAQERGRLVGAAQHILLLTFYIEAAGALLLFVSFLRHGDPVGPATWRAVFTSVSAFCNAGFAVQSNSLVPYQNDPFILHVVALLIIMGGLSPAAVLALPALFRRTTRPISLQIKISLVAAAILLLAGFALILAFEWQGSLDELSVSDRFHNAWFQSVTLRTAGFNSIDISSVRPATLTLMMAWMFIGGSPGGTAGGIKTTTAAVLVLSIHNAVRGHWSITVFGRRVSETTFHKAVVIATLGVLGLILAVLAILLTQSMPARVAIFEVISALGTVGLSVGGTGYLDGVGKVIIIACMFTGRVGTLTLLMFLSQRMAPVPVKRPEEEFDVG